MDDIRYDKIEQSSGKEFSEEQFSDDYFIIWPIYLQIYNASLPIPTTILAFIRVMPSIRKLTYHFT